MAGLRHSQLFRGLKPLAGSIFTSNINYVEIGLIFLTVKGF